MNNVELVRMLRRLNPTATIIGNAIDIQRYDDVRNAGADIVYMSRIAVAVQLSEAIASSVANQVDSFVDAQMQRHGDPKSRREVFS